MDVVFLKFNFMFLNTYNTNEVPKLKTITKSEQWMKN
jgi:hypothetical protein